MNVLGGKKCDCGLIRGYCNCFRLERKPKMSEQWEEIKIEDVRPGDVARCNGREFQVVSVQDHAMTIRAPGMDRYIVRPLFLELGFTFHRRVKREPRTGETIVRLGPGDSKFLAIPVGIEEGTRLRWTELLDGEDGA